VLVRGNRILREELTSEGHVRRAVIRAWTFFWRSVFTSKTASTLQGDRDTLRHGGGLAPQGAWTPLQVNSPVARALLQLLPAPQQLLVQVHVRVPDVLLQGQTVGLGVRWKYIYCIKYIL